jgi:hypothetical protein
MRVPPVIPAIVAGLILVAITAVPATASDSDAHNVVIFVADGLRSVMVNDQIAPNMTRLACGGVQLPNSHALFPTFTMTNASALVTGHAPGDTGLFSNTIFTGFKVGGANDSVTPFLEKDLALKDVDQRLAGNFLNEPSLFDLAQAKNYGAASIGKVGPALLFGHSEPELSIVIDDATGTAKGVSLSDEVIDALNGAGLPTVAPTRGENGKGSGTKSANLSQQDYFAAAATRVVLPILAKREKPFILVFWSRDPDGSQHNQGDNKPLNPCDPPPLSPGINGPTSLAAIRNADDDLDRLRAALAELGIAKTTDIVVVADHGFSTITKEITSPADPGLPLGFVAAGLAKALGMNLSDPDRHGAAVASGAYPRFGNGLLHDANGHTRVVVTANGGSDLIYIVDGDKDGVSETEQKPASDEDKTIAGDVVRFLLDQEYVGGLFVRSDLGTFPGSMSDIMLEGSAVTPTPAVVVSFRSFDASCSEPAACAVEVADTILKQGQGMHGSFSRADTWNFMALAGPDFKTHFVNPAPAGNADVERTLAKVLGLDDKGKDKGKLVGRVLEETLTPGRSGAGGRE